MAVFRSCNLIAHKCREVISLSTPSNFIAEADAGEGLRFPRMIRPWLLYVLPVIIILLFIMGYVEKLRPLVG